MRNWVLIGLVVLAGLFVPYEDVTVYHSVVTGSTTRVNHWLWVFDTHETVDSPLRVWSREHGVVVGETDWAQYHDTFSVISRSYSCGPGPAAFGFTHELQKIYVQREPEIAIRAYLADMMAAPDETARKKLVHAAVVRAVALTNRFSR